MKSPLLETLTPDTWAACPLCNGPSLPREELASYPCSIDAVCAVCGFRWWARLDKARAAVATVNWLAGADLHDDPDAECWREHRAVEWRGMVRGWKRWRLRERARVRRLEAGRW